MINMMKAANNWRSESRELALSMATPFLLYLRRHFQDLTSKSFLHLVWKPNASIHSDLQKMNLRYPTFKQREHNLLSIDFIAIRAIFGESKVHGHPSVLHTFYWLTDSHVTNSGCPAELTVCVLYPSLAWRADKFFISSFLGKKPDVYSCNCNFPSNELMMLSMVLSK